MRTMHIQTFSVALALLAQAAAANPSSFHEALCARVPAIRAALPDVIAAGEASAERIDANPFASIKIPKGECAGLNEELIARAGGLSRVSAKRATPQDILIFGVRDWESFGPRAAWLVERWKNEGNLIIVLGSKAGRPDGLAADFFLDNGAPDGSSAHASVNAAANVALAWMWCCEYASAFSRRGKFPAITKGLISPDSWGHNDGTAAPDGGTRFYKCDTPIAEGDLAIAYLNRFAKLLTDIREPCVTKAIAESAEIIADRIAAGRRVAIAGLGHMILEEPKHDLKSPMIGFRPVNMTPEAFQFVLDKGDLLVWITYSGMNSAWDDYAYAIRRCGADLIASYAETPVPGPRNGFLSFIPQPWASPDAEVAIPVPPYSMAPVSAISRILVLRMLDEEVAAVLKARGIDRPRPEIAMPDAFHDFGQRLRTAAGMALAIPDPGDRWGVLDSNGCVVVKAEYPDPPWVSRGKAYAYADGTNIVFDLATGDATRTAAKPPAPRKPFSPPPRVSTQGKFRFVFTNGLWGAVSKTGDELIPAKYDNLRRISDKLVVSQIGERYGLLDGDGRELLPPVFDRIQPMGGAISVCSNLHYGVFAPDAARFLTPIRYEGAPGNAGNGWVRARIGGKTGVFTLDGEEVVPPVHERIGFVSREGALVANSNRWSFLPLGTNSPSVKGDFSHLEYGPLGGFIAEEGRLFGLLGPDGTPLAPIAYEAISRERDNIRRERIVRGEGGLFILSDNGTARPFPFPCDYAGYLSRQEPPPKGTEPPPLLYRVAKDGKWGVVDANGAVVLPLEYAYVSPCRRGGYAQIAVGGEWRLDATVPPILHGAKWGACDSSGHVTVKPEFDGIEYRDGPWLYVARKRHTIMTP